jgi:hypothetical protein
MMTAATMLMLPSPFASPRLEEAVAAGVGLPGTVAGGTVGTAVGATVVTVEPTAIKLQSRLPASVVYSVHW